jgi:hypothetical protein
VKACVRSKCGRYRSSARRPSVIVSASASERPSHWAVLPHVRSVDVLPYGLQPSGRRLTLVATVHAVNGAVRPLEITKVRLMAAGCIWHGTSTEWDELTEAVTHNCTCGARTYILAPRCAAHQMLDDQRVLDRLLFARRIAARLLREEVAEGPGTVSEQCTAAPFRG